MSKKVTETKAIIGIGSVVQLKSDAGTKRKATVVGFDTFKGTITIIWTSDNGNVGKAEIPALAISVLKS